MRPILALDQSSFKHSSMTLGVSFAKPVKKAADRCRLNCNLNSVSVTRNICTGQPSGPSNRTVRWPCMWSRSCWLHTAQFTSPISETSTVCFAEPEDGNSRQLRRRTSTGLPSASFDIPGAVRMAPSTWKITPSLHPPGTIRAAAKRSAPESSLCRRSAERKPSSEVKAQTACGSGSPLGTCHCSSTRVQPSQAQQVLTCSRSSRSRKMSFSESGTSEPEEQAVANEVTESLLRLVSERCGVGLWAVLPLAKQFAENMRGSPLSNCPGSATACTCPGNPASCKGWRNPSASMVALFPTRCKPYKWWLSRRPFPMAAHPSESRLL
mmetsp:Transcript_129768/g.416352  ORF Transcript_129768/g.416352 Transcript_129768/m.416352 type:complete len:324 (+) Transcript_129768:1007-1978(+)